MKLAWVSTEREAAGQLIWPRALHGDEELSIAGLRPTKCNDTGCVVCERFVPDPLRCICVHCKNTLHLTCGGGCRYCGQFVCEHCVPQHPCCWGGGAQTEHLATEQNVADLAEVSANDHNSLWMELHEKQDDQVNYLKEHKQRDLFHLGDRSGWCIKYVYGGCSIWC